MCSRISPECQINSHSLNVTNQIEKIVLFLLEQGFLASRISKLGEQHDAILQEPEIHKMSELREAYREGIGAVVGLSRNLHELQNRQGSYLSIYDQPTLPLQDPVIDSIKAVVDRLTNSTNFLNFLGQHALIMQEELPTPTEEPVDDERYHFMSLILNLANTFLYMVNTYIIVPTADDYSMSLGDARTVCGIVIGAMAVAQSSIPEFSHAMILMVLANNVVSGSALGLACGPALAGILQTDFKIYKLTLNQNTIPEVNDALEQGLKQPLLITSDDKGDEEADQDYDDSEEASEESRLPATSIWSAYRLLTPSVRICAQLTVSRRILLSESSVITTYYFNWSTSRAALFLACLGLTVLPVNVVVGSYISNMFEDRQILLVSEIMVCIGVLFSFHLIIPYSVPQYICSVRASFCLFRQNCLKVSTCHCFRELCPRGGTYDGGLL
ncbi:hypothetical protein AHAS_Ahas05G0305200 [Arachis hypogaea]